MRLDRRLLNWGVFFVLLGAIPLAVRQNLIDRDVVAHAWQLWPLLIVGVGLGLIFRHSPLEFVGGLLAAGTLGLMLGGLLAVDTDFAAIGRTCGGGSSDRAFATQQGTLAGAASVKVQLSCGDLNVGTTAGSAWAVAGTSADGRAPRVDASSSRLEVRSPDAGFELFGVGARQDWTIKLPQDPTLDVDLTLNAGSGTLNLAGAHVGVLSVQGNAGAARIDLAEASVARLALQVNAGSAKVTLPNSSLSGNVEVNAGSVSLCAPEGVALRIATNDNITGSNNYGEQGLVKAGSTWQSPNYATAQARIDLTTTANAGSFTLNPKDGCT